MLRVFLSAPPRADRADRWVRYSAEGRVTGRGDDVPARWPTDAHTEVVLGADQVRLIALALPPMPRERLRGAARYALEDQIAGSIDESSIAVADRTGGTCVAAVASEALIGAIAADERRVVRILPESALAPHADGWSWYASEAGDGFVRRADGSAFGVSAAASANGTLPCELTAALAQAARAGAAASQVHVAFAADAAQLAAWSRIAGLPFVAAPAWRWDTATPAAFAAAPDFLRERTHGKVGGSRGSIAGALRPALILAGAALAIHLCGLVLEWSWLNLDNWRLSRALVAEAQVAQLANADTPAAAFAGIARRNAQLRHRALQPAPADALPLLARAAPSLAALPPGALHAAHYADAAWTLDLGKLEPAALARVTRGLTATGVDALAAPSPGGTRMRLSLAPTAR